MNGWRHFLLRYLLKRDLTMPCACSYFLFTYRRPEKISTLEDLVLYKNHNTGIFLHANRNIVVTNSHFADNGNCVTHALHNAAPGNWVEDSKCVGMSQDVLERFGTVCRKGIMYTVSPQMKH